VWELPAVITGCEEEVVVVGCGSVSEELAVTTTLCGRRGMGWCKGPPIFEVGEDDAEERIGTDVELGMRVLRGICCWGLFPVFEMGAGGAGGVMGEEVTMLCGRRGIG
jgi:hypothetical protein